MTPLPEEDATERLESWKAIAERLGKSVTTVRRWEREEGLPVRRQEHLKRGSVVAFGSELDTWLRSRTTPLPEQESLPVAAPRRKGRRLLVLTSGAVVLAATCYLLTAETPLVRVGHLLLTPYPGHEGRASFAPGGEKFAYIAGHRSVWIKQLTVDKPWKLHEEAGRRLGGLRWSPDGRWIALASSPLPTGGWEILLIDPATGSRRFLTAGGPELDWTRDSKAVIHASRTVPGGSSAMYEYDLQTGRNRQISFPPKESWGDIAGAQSPEGKQLAVTRYLDFGQGDIYVSDYGSKDARRITHLKNWILGVDWLSSGHEVVFGGAYDQEGIFRIDTRRESAPELVSRTVARSIFPQASYLKDRTERIAYTREKWNTDLLKFDPATREIKVMAATTEAEEVPDISAGGRLVFMSDRTGGPDLWECDPGCAEPRQITFWKAPYVEMWPRWSPDERSIAFNARVNGRSSILVMNRDGSGQRVVSTGFDEGSPSWSADGRTLYFRSNRSGAPEIWRAPVNGETAPTQLTRGGAVEAFESADRRYLYFIRTAQDSVLQRLSLADGSTSEVPEVGRLSLGRWRVAGDSILFWRVQAPPALRQFDLSTKRIVDVAPTGKGNVISFSALPSGVAVWSQQVSEEADLRAVHLRRRPFWH
jgi:Tol biopolymer transport system component/predicted DNA-binding transcriptional regulator AlpA